MKKCCGPCERVLEDQKFYIKRYKNGTVGLRSYCKDCSRKERDTWRASSSRDNERNKQYNKEHAAEIRGKKLANNYWPELTWQAALDKWRSMYTAQNGKCLFGHETTRLHVDHCHETGKVRGLLCYNCNNGIGRFKENIDVLKQVVIYLEKNKEPE